MITREQLQPKAALRGIVLDTLVTVVSVQGFFDGGGHRVHYLRRPFTRKPDFGVTSVNYDCADLIARAEPPR